jgi:NAD(P)-dependent dehydrogenase (short-subunit alcohol dehydrogenase family)
MDWKPSSAGKCHEGGIMEIKESVSIITGGASGLGEATARSLVGKGGKVALLDLNAERGEKISAELGDSAVFFPLDVVRTDEVDDVVKKIKGTFGAIHTVINCAGLGGSMKIMGKEGLMPIDWFTSRVDINLLGTFNVIRATAPLMMENTPNDEGERGVCINTASVAAFDGQVGQSAYAASKGGIVSMTLSLAREFANDGIRVMSILPGIMDTPLMAKYPQKVLDRLGSQVPFPPRLGKPDEFASLACHIIANSYLNGEHIRLDGALRMGFGRK